MSLLICWRGLNQTDPSLLLIVQACTHVNTSKANSNCWTLLPKKWRDREEVRGTRESKLCHSINTSTRVEIQMIFIKRLFLSCLGENIEILNNLNIRFAIRQAPVIMNLEIRHNQKKLPSRDLFERQTPKKFR